MRVCPSALSLEGVRRLICSFFFVFLKISSLASKLCWPYVCFVTSMFASVFDWGQNWHKIVLKQEFSWFLRSWLQARRKRIFLSDFCKNRKFGAPPSKKCSSLKKIPILPKKLFEIHFFGSHYNFECVVNWSDLGNFCRDRNFDRVRNQIHVFQNWWILFFFYSPTL